MPFKSKAQARFMFAKKPELAKEFAEKTKSIKSLPQHVREKKEMEKKSHHHTKAVHHMEKAAHLHEKAKHHMEQAKHEKKEKVLIKKLSKMHKNK